jgi:hypothetical protein
VNINAIPSDAAAIPMMAIHATVPLFCRDRRAEIARGLLTNLCNVMFTDTSIRNKQNAEIESGHVIEHKTMAFT